MDMYANWRRNLYVVWISQFLAMIVFGIFSWQGPISLLIMLGLAINTVFLSLGKPQVLRYSILVTCTMILLYNVGVFSLGGILNEGFAIVSSIVGILRYRRKKEPTL